MTEPAEQDLRLSAVSAGSTRSKGPARPAGRRIPILLVAALLVLVLAPLLVLLTRDLWLRWLAIMALAWWLPGALWVALWRLPRLDAPSAGVLALGLGLCWMVSLALLLYYIPGPLDLWLLLGAYELGALGLLCLLFWRRPIRLQPASRATWAWLGALVLIACLLRLPGVGYPELHGDETMVLLRAGRAIEGSDDVLARHAKGPGEIAVALVLYRALGTADEATARLPFALMGAGSVLATAVLGWRRFSGATGFWAGVLLAANGFALALSRIVQYQGAVLLLSVLAVLAAWEFAQEGEGRWLALAALFSGFGVLMHYEFALLAPLLLVLAWLGLRRAGSLRRVLPAALAGGLLAVAVVAATYLPGVLNPRFARTQRYLGNRLGGIGALNGALFVEMGAFYGGTWYLAGLLLLVAAGLVLGWLRARRRTLLLALWFLPFLILHLLIMQYPGTHFYIFMPSWVLLGALPLAAVTEAKALRPLIRWGLLGLACAWLLVSAGYLYLAFFRQAPEYVVNYEQERLPLYWAPYGEQAPLKPRYAFPIQEGWKALGTLAGWGCLQGTFASNEASQSLQYWYLAPLRRVEFDEGPDWVFVASHVQTQFPRYDTGYLEGYQRVGEMRVRGEPRIELWSRGPLPVPYVAYDAEALVPAFDGAVPALGARPDPPAQAGEAALGDALTLVSASLERTTLRPGEVLQMLLVWHPEQALAGDYKLFLHVADEGGRPVAQWDGRPCLNLGSTGAWVPGEAVRDHVVMVLPEDMPPGEYSVLVGLYDPASGERLGGRAIEVATITVR